jgi:DNA modification methylase
MKSWHKILVSDARQLSGVDDESVECIVTSPPYPMIEMWDDVFSKLNPLIGNAFKEKNGLKAFRLMHEELDKVWMECYRVLKPGCIACVNIGDAVRTINGHFQMYSNHARIISSMGEIGFTQLPDILWRKQTNAPNKFMGSGMLPACAYVTYEHEYILIFRKGEKRKFVSRTDKLRRRQSAYFWEERNIWFSDVWTDLKGTSQPLADKSVRDRSAAYPFELAYRLICMHTVYGDTILDPFLGTGTTTAAAVASCRNSIGIDIEKELQQTIQDTILSSLNVGKKRVTDRLSGHKEFIRARYDVGKRIKYLNKNHDVGTVTAQETDIMICVPARIKKMSEQTYEVDYEFARPDVISKSDQLPLFGNNSPRSR